MQYVSNDKKYKINSINWILKGPFDVSRIDLLTEDATAFVLNSDVAKQSADPFIKIFILHDQWFYGDFDICFGKGLGMKIGPKEQTYVDFVDQCLTLWCTGISCLCRSIFRPDALVVVLYVT